MCRKGEPFFSVIVPVYNVQNYLDACVGSVAEQPGPRDWECILVDDGSTDKSGILCDALAAEIAGVTALHRPNGGLAAARNTGLAAARGRWVLFLDSDDKMAPGLLPALRAELAAHPDERWLVGRYTEFFEDTGETRAPDHLDFVPGPFESADYAARVARLYDAARWSVWKYCIRRDWLASTGVTFYKEVRWAEDWPFDLALLLHTDRLYFTDTVFTIYRSARAGSLLTDAGNLPRRFAGIAAAWKRLSALDCTDAQRAEMLDRAADVFWPQARTAAVKDKAMRRACAAAMERCRPLFGAGREVTARRDWRLFRRLLNAFGPRFALWAAALGRR